MSAAIAVEYFDIWQAGYAGASVAIYDAGTTTLASVFSDEALTTAAANPQTLQSMSQDGRNFGKFANPVYIGGSYELAINGTDRTGVIDVPLTTLSAQDASAALITPTGGSASHTLADVAARVVAVEDSGIFLPTSNPSASSATNNATLTAAIGVASAAGGGFVMIPAGMYNFTSLSIPANVMLVGKGRDVTTLSSVVASNVVTIAGERGGFADLTLDGASLLVGSVGVYMLAKNETRIENATVKRFRTGIHCHGGRRAQWRDLYVENCYTGALLTGDINGVAADGDEFRYNYWDGGRVTNCLTVGVHLKFVDRKCWHNSFEDVGFENNTGVALKVEGARWTDLDGCWWVSNTGGDITVLDGSNTALSEQNTVIGLHVSDFIIGNAMSFTGKCQDIVFERGEFLAGTYTLTTVGNTILSKDSVESGSVALAGNDTTQWMRARSIIGDFPASSGVTTDATATEAWSYDIAPGERVFLDAKVVANARNTIDYAVYHITQGAHCTGSTLAYDNQTSNFTLGDMITGATSGARARITADADSGATGTLTLRDIAGEFTDDETIAGDASGSAQANGVLSHQAAALLGTINTPSAAVESDGSWACIFAVTARKVRVLVTGAAAKTIDWSVAVQVTSG